MIATSAFIWAGDPSATIDLVERLLPDRADLIQKVRWMLREVGKRVVHGVLTTVLERHAASIGRNALSYAVEDAGQERLALIVAAEGDQRRDHLMIGEPHRRNGRPGGDELLPE